MNSFKDCQKSQSLAEDRLVYIAAYDMYARSGNQQKMAAARAQFPSVTELLRIKLERRRKQKHFLLGRRNGSFENPW
jgi:hypothetical protein